MATADAPERHPSLYLLTDHLDAALAMGEDLLTERVALGAAAHQPSLRGWMRESRDLANFLTSVRTLEYAITARLLQARKRAEDLKRREKGLSAGLQGLPQLTIGEDYLVAGRIRLGTLLDLVATFLDTLDLLFDLYAEPADVGARVADGNDAIAEEAMPVT
jgi:hypothetical protein